MLKDKKIRSLEESVLLLQQEVKSNPVSIGKILEILSGRGRLFIVLLLTLPFCLPIQIPGLSIPFGLIIAFIGMRTAFGKRAFLPKCVLSKEISAETLNKIIDKLLGILRKIERLIHPRLEWICCSSTMNLVNGLVIFVLGLFLSLPLPIPLSNLSAAWSLLLISLGILKNDGVFVFIGYFVSILTIGFFVITAISMKHILWAL